ncbi:MAG: serine protease [Acidobacteria bacterium]|nr:serine protease [Acidobacteriota bacterium]
MIINRKTVLLLTYFIIINSFIGLSDRHIEEKVKDSVVKVIMMDDNGKTLGYGTGFFLTSTRIITNRHVISAGSKARILSIDNKTYPVQGVAAYDELLDLVLLEVDVPLGKFKSLDTYSFLPRIGEEIIVIGNPWGKGSKTTTGVVTNILEWKLIGKVIEYDAQTYPGSSGSPVFNSRGNILGINTWGKRTKDEHHGYAIPCDNIVNLSWGMIESIPEFNERIKNILLGKRYFTIAQNMVESQQYNAAIPYLNKVIELNPDFAASYALLGYCIYKKGEMEEAIKLFDKALDRNRDLKDVYIWKGYVYQAMLEFKKAIDSFETAIIYDSENVESLYNLGILYLENGDCKKARYFYDELKEVDSSRARTLGKYINQEIRKIQQKRAKKVK